MGKENKALSRIIELSLRWIPDSIYLRIKFLKRIGYMPNLRKPVTYNEKLQWLKLHDRRSIFTTFVDKYDAKLYVSEILGNQYVIPTLGVWDRFEDIDFSILPNQFVLKCTHDSGGLVICKDKSKLDLELAKQKMNRSLQTNYYWHGREWPYKNVKPRIIAEQYMEDLSTGELRDYKVYTFEGKARFCMINQSRGTDTRADYYDREYNPIPLIWGYKPADIPPQKPQHYDTMFNFSELLSKGTHELRVDFYEVNGHLFIGELTLFDGSGFDKIEPKEWDVRMGSWINLE